MLFHSTVFNTMLNHHHLISPSANNAKTMAEVNYTQYLANTWGLILIDEA